MPLEDRDAAFVEAVVGALTGLIVAVHKGDQLRIVGELGLLLTAIVELNSALRPSDAALLRAIEVINGR